MFRRNEATGEGSLRPPAPRRNESERRGARSGLANGPRKSFGAALMNRTQGDRTNRVCPRESAVQMKKR